MAAPVARDPHPADDGLDAIPVALRGLEALQDDDASAFAEHESVGIHVEWAATVRARERPDPAEDDQVVRNEREVCAADDRDVAASRAEVQNCLMKRDERGGARRVGRECGPAEVEGLRDARGEHAPEVADHRVLVDARETFDGSLLIVGVGRRDVPEGAVEELSSVEAHRRQLSVLDHRRADEHAGPLVRQSAHGVACVFERRAGQVEDQSLLGIHDRDAARW